RHAARRARERIPRTRRSVSEESRLPLSPRQARAEPQEKPGALRTVGCARSDLRLVARSDRAVALPEADRRRERGGAPAFGSLRPDLSGEDGKSSGLARILRRPFLLGSTRRGAALGNEGRG